MYVVVTINCLNQILSQIPLMIRLAGTGVDYPEPERIVPHQTSLSGWGRGGGSLGLRPAARDLRSSHMLLYSREHFGPSIFQSAERRLGAPKAL